MIRGHRAAARLQEHLERDHGLRYTWWWSSPRMMRAIHSNAHDDEGDDATRDYHIYVEYDAG